MSHDMRKIILNQNGQIIHSLAVNQKVKLKQKFDSIILAGLGGSGHPGDLLNALGITKVPLYVHRNYDLPLGYLKQLGLTKPLVLVSSYSGNTEEAISAYQLARQKKLPLLVSSAGGRLAAWAKRDQVPHIKIAFPDMQPRHTLFAAFTGIARALINCDLADDISDDLVRVASVLTKVTPGLEEPAKNIAAKINGRIPVYYATDNLGFAVKNLKIQTNENAKYPAFWHTFPELNHNELIGFSQLAAAKNSNLFFALMLRDAADHPRNSARIEVTTELYRQWGVSVEHVSVKGETALEKIFFAVTFGLWLTYHLANLNNLDPVTVAGVEDFKKRLAEIAGEDIA